MKRTLPSAAGPYPQGFQAWVAQALDAGEVFLYPSDTVYGLGCNALDLAAVDKVREAKDRSADKNFLLLLGSQAMLQAHFELGAEESSVLGKAWPGPFTCLLRPRGNALDHLRGPDGRVGVRWPAAPWLQELFRLWPGLLLSTSANRSGAPYVHEAAVVECLFEGRVDHSILLQEYPPSMPSALIEWSGTWSTLREGPLDLARFLA